MLCRGDGMVDMLGLEPSAVRCAGSIPVPGKEDIKVILCCKRYLNSYRLVH